MPSGGSAISEVCGWLKQASNLLALLAGALGSLVTIFGWTRVPRWIGPTVIVLGAAYLAASAYRRWVRPPPRLVKTPVVDGTTLVRLRPFERGDHLLGRDREIDQLVAIVRALEFRFGYLSGEAGAGKTSLLRAGLGPRLAEREPDWGFLYVPRPTPRPDLELHRRVLEFLAAANGDVDDFDKLGSLVGSRTAPLLVVCDQFEEFFLTCRTAEGRAPVIENLKRLWAIGQASGRLRLLLCLRKEFVDDLLSLASELPNLRLQDWRASLSNLPVDVAEKEVIGAIADSGELPLAPQLRPRIAADLARDGRVRPVELQIVLTRMMDGQIYDLATYEERGGARGIVSRFITDTISPPDRTVPELDRQVARHILRALCAADFTARRPGGLPVADLPARVIEQLSAAPGGSAFSASDVRQAVDRVVTELRRSWIIVEEGEERVNLAHDYLAPAVREATADIETAEERANNLLDQFVAQARFIRRPIPFRMRRYLQHYASAERLARTESRSLMGWSRRRDAAAVVLLTSFGLAAVAAGWMLPLGWESRSAGARMLLDGSITVSADHRLLGVLKNNRLALVRLDARKLRAIPIEASVLDYVLSPTGDGLLVLGKDGTIWEGKANADFALHSLVPHSGWTYQLGRRIWANFSTDGKWIFAITRDGRVLASPVQQPPRVIATLSLLASWFSGAVPASNQQYPPPPALMSRGGRFLAVVDGASVRIIPTRAGANASPDFSYQLNRSDPLWRFSPDEHRFAIVDEHNHVLETSLPSPATAPSQPFQQQEQKQVSDRYQGLDYSPDSRWLIAREVFGDFLTWEIGTGVTSRAIDLPSSGMDSEWPLQFDPSGRWVLGLASDMQLHLWELKRPPGNSSTPLLKEELSPEGLFGGGRQTGAFCRNSSGVVISGSDGMLYRMPLAVGGEPSAITRLLPAVASFTFFKAFDELVIYNSNQVATGHCGRGRFAVSEFSNTVVDVARGGDDRDLLVIDRKGITRLRRSFMLFGLPVWNHRWPALERNPDNASS